MVKPTCPEVRADSGMRPVMGTDALAWHRQRLAGGSFAKPFLEPPKGQTALWMAPFVFRAYLEEKKLVGAKHNYKYECKQLRATVRYLHRKIDKLRALCDAYLKKEDL